MLLSENICVSRISIEDIPAGSVVTLLDSVFRSFVGSRHIENLARYAGIRDINETVESIKHQVSVRIIGSYLKLFHRFYHGLECSPEFCILVRHIVLAVFGDCVNSVRYSVCRAC